MHEQSKLIKTSDLLHFRVRRAVCVSLFYVIDTGSIGSRARIEMGVTYLPFCKYTVICTALYCQMLICTAKSNFSTSMEETRISVPCVFITAGALLSPFT